jgi:hypothetical protein
MTIQYFLHDPDGDPDRFGDGMYYSIPGEPGWNGLWMDRQECRQVYREELEVSFASLGRRMGIYGLPPAPDKRRFLMRFGGRLDPTAFDVWYMLWDTGNGRMTAVVNAPTLEESVVLLKRCAFVTGEPAVEEGDHRRDLRRTRPRASTRRRQPDT